MKLADCGAELSVNGAELEVQEARNTQNVIVVAAVGLVFMIGGFILLVASLIKTNTPAFSESCNG